MWLGKVDCVSLCMRIVMSTVSNALVRSSATSMDLSVGLFWLRPADILWVMSCRAVVVEWFDLKPCWCGGEEVCSCRVGRSSFSMVLAIGERRATGR